MYSERILDHFRRPRHVGEIPNATSCIEVSNPVCGDLMKLWVVVRDGKICQAKFKAAGCVPAVACGSWLTETLLGKLVAELHSITADQIERALGGLPPASRHAALLAADVVGRLSEQMGL